MLSGKVPYPGKSKAGGLSGCHSLSQARLTWPWVGAGGGEAERIQTAALGGGT